MQRDNGIITADAEPCRIAEKLTQSLKREKEQPCSFREKHPHEPPPPSASAELAILVVAAGRGARAGDGPPKQYRSLAGRTVLAHTLAALHRAAPEALIAPVIHPDDLELYRASVAALDASAARRA